MLRNRRSEFHAAMFMVLLRAFWTCPATGAEPNDSYANVTVLPSGVFFASDTLFSALYPDTVLGAFDASGILTHANDDASSLGDGAASELVGLPILFDGSLRLGLTGYDDFDFDGRSDATGARHEQFGVVEFLIDIHGSDGSLLESFSEFPELLPGEITLLNRTNTSWSGGTANVTIDNTVDLPMFAGDLDYWRFRGLRPGALFVAEMSAGELSGVVTVLDEQGTPLTSGLSSLAGVPARVVGLATPTGDVNVVSTGTGDYQLEGAHLESGEYRLTILTDRMVGDFNEDDHVDVNDFGFWTQAIANVDIVNRLDGVDFLAWQRYLGTAAPLENTSNVHNVPEPQWKFAWFLFAVLLILARSGLNGRWKSEDGGVRFRYGSGGTFTLRVTVPSEPLMHIDSPSRIAPDACGILTIGIPNCRATTAACDNNPPRSAITPATCGKMEISDVSSDSTMTITWLVAVPLRNLPSCTSRICSARPKVVPGDNACPSKD